MLVAVRFDGVPSAVERQLHAAAVAAATPLDAEQAQRFWQRLAAFPAPAGGVLVRAGAPPAALAELLAALGRHAPGPTQRVVYSHGLAFARWPAADGPELARALAALRAALAPHHGYAVVEDAPPPLRATLDLWGPPPESLPLMRALKQQWDPRGILNPGRYLL